MSGRLKITFAACSLYAAVGTAPAWAACDIITSDCYGVQAITGAGANNVYDQEAENDGIVSAHSASFVSDPAFPFGSSESSASSRLIDGAIRLNVTDTYGGAYATGSWFERASFNLPQGVTSMDVPLEWHISGFNNILTPAPQDIVSSTRSATGSFRFRALQDGYDSVDFQLTNCYQSICADGANGVIFSDVMNIFPDVLYELSMDMSIFGRNARMNFLNTAYINLSLPEGVSINSSSGVLLSQQIVEDPASAVPEPSTWAMMLVGFGAVGIAMRRRNGPGITVRPRSA